MRKISYGEGVERVFPIYSPYIAEIEVLRRGKVRRAKLYYLRGRRGKSARIFERTDARAKRLNAAFKGFKRPKGEPDDLTRIKGVNAELAGKLHGLGVIKFDQIANFSDDDIANVDETLALEGRIEKDDWVRQAQGSSPSSPPPRCRPRKRPRTARRADTGIRRACRPCLATSASLPAPPRAQPFAIGRSASRAPGCSGRMRIPRSPCIRTRSPST